MRRRHLVPRFWSSAVKYSKMMISQNLLTPHLTLLHLWHFIKIYFKLLGNAKLNRIHAKAVFWWSEAFHALISHTHESILQMISKKGFLGFFLWFCVRLVLFSDFWHLIQTWSYWIKQNRGFLARTVTKNKNKPPPVWNPVQTASW